MEEVLVALITSEAFKWVGVGFIALVLAEVGARLLEPKQKHGLVYWVDRFLETLVRVVNKRLRRLRDLMKK